ncbi:class I SAM-dependent methyltransferase [Noviherbaspirillum massiliense]|uniref:class I SAM-dependent methyltransferase n=1 Tax=Noviherbaspirillum massiliense TaxID=1465823 RepID=UPI0002FE4CCF|nr:class I SAM-dependent methyltransferase [Noviherbaspirillum massiliense]
MKNAASTDYRIAPAEGWIDRILHAQRRRLFDAFTAFRRGGANDTVLNVGMLPAPFSDNGDYLMAWSDAQERARILSYEIERPGFGKHRAHSAAATGKPRSEDLRLPFADASFDWVFCDEIIEHMGSAEQQYLLLEELTRVARKGVFVTTSNRRHPLEFHTGLPFLHWLPAMWWRRFLKLMGKGAWAAAPGLRLLDSRALYEFASRLPGKPQHDVGHKRVFGIKAHFFLMIEKKPAAS